jgi:mannose-6-phosphate isomerase-like protein (cupin superfamily)
VSVAGYTIKNLEEIENAAKDTSDVEAKLARKYLDSEHLGVSYFRYGPGFRAGFGHSHREQEEAYVVISGSGRMKLGDEIVELRRWDVVRVAPDVVRGLEGGPEGLELIVVGSDRPEEGDGVPDPDFWTE